MLNGRAVAELAQRSDPDFFAEVALGMRLATANALGLWRDFMVMHRAGRRQGAEILSAFVEEEAAKFFILLDAVRCPRTSQQFGRQLRYFYDHLAKGIYALHYTYFPADFAEVQRYVASHREEYYLDGPEGFKWIFRNQILEGREANIYVNYVRTDEGLGWVSPRRRLIAGPWRAQPETLALARTMCRLGFAMPESLARVAEVWRPFVIEDGTTWGAIQRQNAETLDALERHGLLKSREFVEPVLERWTFPLYPLDLQADGTKVQDLIKHRRKLEDSWERSVYGVPDGC
jgi:AbiV family abortive infection protein